MVSRIVGQDKETIKIGGAPVFASPGKYRKANKRVNDLDDFQKCVLRCTIFEMYDNGEYPTMKKIVALMKEKIQYQGSVTSMHTLLKSMGFNYKRTADGRKFLMERVDIVVARIKFLRAMHAITESGDDRPIFYLDETYVIKIIQEKKSGRTPKKQRSLCSYGQRQLTHCLSRQFCKNWEQMGLPFASSK